MITKINIVGNMFEKKNNNNYWHCYVEGKKSREKVIRAKLWRRREKKSNYFLRSCSFVRVHTANIRKFIS